MNPSDLISLLNNKGFRLSLAESCTGGMIGAMITSVPGSSSCFLGSAVTYSNESKERLLGVRHETLLAHGAVSRETAVEMAFGSLKAYDSDIAGSVTGIAGPGGGTEEKPVGTVYMCVTDGLRKVVFQYRFEGGRESVRRQTAEMLMDNISDFIGGIL